MKRQTLTRVTIALILAALFLVATVMVQGQNPPTTYQGTSDGFDDGCGDNCGPPGDPATWASYSNLPWNFQAVFPAAYAYQSQNLEGTNEWTWSYGYYSGGSFVLGDGTYTFTGTFTSGYGWGDGEQGGPQAEELFIDMFFTGEWNTGLKQSGTMNLVEADSYDGGPSGMATLAFSPAPEPGSLLLFGSGALGLLGMLRHKRRG